MNPSTNGHGAHDNPIQDAALALNDLLMQTAERAFKERQPGVIGAAHGVAAVCRTLAVDGAMFVLANEARGTDEWLAGFAEGLVGAATIITFGEDGDDEDCPGCDTVELVTKLRQFAEEELAGAARAKLLEILDA